MPRRRVVSDDEDEFMPTQASTSGNLSRTNVTQGGHDAEEVDHLANNVVKFILNNSVTKIPFKRQDITKNVLNGNNKLFETVFKQACDKLEDVYGMSVTQLTDSKSIKQYISYSTFTASSALDFNEEQRHEVALLFLVLSYIYMKGSEITEHSLFDFLETIHIERDEVHPYFGDVNKYIKEIFPKQHYLRRQKMEIEGVNEERINLKWGQRAEEEFDKKELLQAVCRIMGKPAQSFVNQYNDAYAQDLAQQDQVPATQVIDDDVDM